MAAPQPDVSMSVPMDALPNPPMERPSAMTPNVVPM